MQTGGRAESKIKGLMTLTQTKPRHVTKQNRATTAQSQDNQHRINTEQSDYK